MFTKKKILFVAYGGGHVNMIVPVAKAMMQRPDCEIHVLGLTTAGPVLADAGIPHIGFRDILEAGDEAALAWGRRLSEGLDSSLVSWDETVAYLGLSYVDLETQHGIEGAARLYAEKGRHVFLPVGALERLLRKLSPDLVVATNAPRGERAAILAANKLGIPSVCLLDLYPSEDGVGVAENWCGTRICVLNDTVKDSLVRLGRNASHIVVTGNPAFDKHYLHAAQRDLVRFREGDVVVGLASNILPGLPSGELQRVVFEQLQGLCARKGYKLAVRQHPNETRWLDIGQAVDCNRMPIEAFLGSLDMLVTFPSTIALEAQIHGVRVGLLDFTSLSDACAYLFDAGFESIKAVEDIPHIEVNRARNARGDVAPVSGTTKVCEVILQVMENIN